MKDLKFRAWNKQLKHFKYFDLATCLPCYADESNFVVQQWTGILDRNKLPIYEGDILAPRLRVWHNGKRAYTRTVKMKDILNWMDDESVAECFEEEEIIGNIFQNESLLA